MIKNIDKILSKALIEQGLIKKDQLDRAIKQAGQTTSLLPSVLFNSGLISEEKILNILAKEMRMKFINLKTIPIDKSVIDKVPLKFASYYKFVPLKIENGLLTVAVSYPLDIKTQDEIRTHLGYDIEMVLSFEHEIIELLQTHYGLAAETIQKIISKTPQKQSIEVESVEEKIEDIEKMAEEESVVKLVNQIISEAYKRRATDIHIEPYRGKVKIRYRIDGVLHNAPVPQEMVHFFSSILSRIKIMSNLNIIERRIPQDGRAVVKVQDQILDLRVSSVPTPYSESLVIRMLPTTMLFSLEKLGLSDTELKIFEDLVKKPHGIIFVTGPTGSGKTTTLYTCLSRINTDKRKIVTIEDPIEYELEGITQMQVAPDIGLDFAKGLRSMLRHDPDVMMLGEVRDRETADIAIRVALTGHLVFSTLHTNDAASGIIRLIDIGIEPYLVASSVIAFIAQRLVRVVCPKCKIEDENQPQELKVQIAKDLGLSSISKIVLYRGQGCKECNSTGYYGRTAIYEILLIDEALKELITKGVPAGKIKKLAVERGMLTLRQDGWRKVLEGLTTPEEVLNITPAEEYEEERVTVFRAEGSPLHDSLVDKEQLRTGRRVYARLNTKVNVSYKIIKAKEKITKLKYLLEKFATTEDISAGGLVFVSSDPIPVGAILELKIELPDAAQPIGCLAKVLRTEEIEIDKVYNIAVCFLDMPSGERARLNKYVEEELVYG